MDLVEESKQGSILNEDDIKFLTELANEMITQDRRATADPYYFTVQTRTRETGYDTEYSDDVCYVETYTGDYGIFDTREEAMAALCESAGVPLEDAESKFVKCIVETGYKWVEKDHNFFLTYKGFLEHMRQDAHNYPGRQNGATFKEDERVYSYVYHAKRNPEVRRLFEIIKKFATIKGEKS